MRRIVRLAQYSRYLRHQFGIMGIKSSADQVFGRLRIDAQPIAEAMPTRIIGVCANVVLHSCRQISHKSLHGGVMLAQNTGVVIATIHRPWANNGGI